jgi:hypothetical protein
MIDINKICEDLYNGVNYPGMWHGSEEWGISSDFHEHPFFIWDCIKNFLPDRPIDIIETGRCTGQSTNLFSGIAQKTGGQMYSFDPQDWGRELILNINKKYNITSNYNYIVDLSFNADNHLPLDFKSDIVFLDSLHTYNCVKQETLLFEKRLKDKSIIFFHDTVWCFDSVMGWILEYLENKDVCFAKHQNTHKLQCYNCENLWGKPGLIHGRPHIMTNGRPNFQGESEVKCSPYYEKLNYNNIKWSNKTFDEALKTENLVFTNIESCCGIGALFINKKV